MSRKVLTVSEVISDVNEKLSRTGELWIEGEVSNLRPSGPGHLYFTIKDDDAQLGVVMFSMWARGLRFKVENGVQLILRGRLGIYEPQGRFQLKADYAEPAGVGALQLAFEQMKERLAKEGLFDESRKKPLPLLPGRIAVVTSPNGAAVRDVLNVLGRRFAGLSIQIFPVRVQGNSAADEITSALGHLSRWNRHDVILLCRGGGSMEDLWPFNEERVARAIATCQVPIISGVGHETDTTIADFVADKRAPTPSAAAEIVVQAKDQIASRVENAHRRIVEIVERQVSGYRAELRHLSSSDGLGRVPIRVERVRKRLQDGRVALTRLLDRHAKSLRARLKAADEPLRRFPERLAIPRRIHQTDSLQSTLVQLVRSTLEAHRSRLRTEAARLEAVSPLSVLSRGYAIAYQFDGRRKRPIQDASRVSIGEKIEIQLRRGRLDATVDATTMGLESVWPETEENDTDIDGGSDSAEKEPKNGKGTK